MSELDDLLKKRHTLESIEVHLPNVQGLALINWTMKMLNSQQFGYNRLTFVLECTKNRGLTLRKIPHVTFEFS